VSIRKKAGRKSLYSIDFSPFVQTKTISQELAIHRGSFAEARESLNNGKREGSKESVVATRSTSFVSPPPHSVLPFFLARLDGAVVGAAKSEELRSISRTQTFTDNEDSGKNWKAGKRLVPKLAELQPVTLKGGFGQRLIDREFCCWLPGWTN
jgi:hypothetical protein